MSTKTKKIIRFVSGLVLMGLLAGMQGQSCEISTDVGPGGSVYPESAILEAGAKVTFYVNADSGYRIERVEGCNGRIDSASESELEYTIDPVKENCTIRARFFPVESDDVESVFPSSFSEVLIQRFGGLGYCPQPGMLLSGAVEIKDGVAVISGRLLVSVPENDLFFQTPPEECSDEDNCWVVQELEPRTLDTDELDELRAHVSAVETKQCEEFDNISLDPCLVTRIKVDGLIQDDFCNGIFHNSEAFKALAAYLDSLAVQ